MQVRVSQIALRELEAITDYIAKDSRTRAESFARELLDCCSGLAEYGTRYPVIAEWRNQTFHRAPYRSYVIIYTVETDEVRVHHIVHSARDYMRLLFPED